MKLGDKVFLIDFVTGRICDHPEKRGKVVGTGTLFAQLGQLKGKIHPTILVELEEGFYSHPRQETYITVVVVHNAYLVSEDFLKEQNCRVEDFRSANYQYLPSW